MATVPTDPTSGHIRTQLGVLRYRLNKALKEAESIIQKPRDFSTTDTAELDYLLNETQAQINLLNQMSISRDSLMNAWTAIMKKDKDEKARQTEYFAKYGQFPSLELNSALQHLQRFKDLCAEEVKSRLSSKSYVASENPSALLDSSPVIPPSTVVLQPNSSSSTPPPPATTVPPQIVPPQIIPTHPPTSLFPRSAFLEHAAPTIKPFTGIRTEYHDFRALFSTVYGAHPSLSPIQKLCALKNLLRGEPYQLICSLPLTASNYDIALSTLDQLYGRTRPLLQTLHQQLLALPALHPNERNTHKILSTYVKVVTLVQQIQNAGINSTDSQTMGMTVRTKFPRWINSKLQTREKNEVFSMEQVLNEIRAIIEEETVVDELYQQSLTEKTMFTSTPPHQRNVNHNHNNARANPVHRNLVNHQRTDFPHHRNDNQRNDNQRNGPSARSTNPTCPFCNKSHYAGDCPLSIQQRQAHVRQHQMCYNCLGSHLLKDCPSRFSCRQCGKRHHSALHSSTRLPNPQRPQQRTHQPVPGLTHTTSRRSWIPPRTQTHYVDEQPNLEPTYTNFVPNSSVPMSFPPLDSTHNCNHTDPTEPTPLQCIEVQAHNPSNPELQEKLLIFFDSGSTRSYITTAAARKLQLPITKETELHVNTFANNETQTISSTHHELLLDSLTDKPVPITVLAIPQLTKSIPTVLVPPVWQLLSTEPEQLDYVSRTPDILIGSDLLWTLWDIGGPNFYTQDIGNGFTILNTLLGPIATRKRILTSVLRNPPHNDVCMTAITPDDPDRPLLVQIQNLFDNSLIQDEPDNFDKNSPDEHPAMKFVLSTLLQDPADGRYFIRFPVKDPPLQIPDMRPLAVRKQMFVFRELKKRPELEVKYFGYFTELLRDGVIEEVPPDELDNPSRTVCYISHFGVFKDSATTSARPVFNATEHLKGYDSLNSQLDPGPSLLRSLQELLLEIRCFPKLISGDIKRAFLQLGLQDTDRDLFRFLLPKDPDQPPSAPNLIDMRFRRMPFGPTSSPFLLQAVIRFHLQHNNLDLAQEINKYIYVDNIFLPFNDTAEALQKQTQTKDIFNNCAMTVREWWSNDPDVNAQLALREGSVQPAKKILGLHFDHQSDMFSVRPATVPDITQGWTKRKLLAFLGSTFDPLGFLCPVTTTLKLQFQNAMRPKIALDERFLDVEVHGLNLFLQSWSTEPLCVPRKITESPELGHELHVFSDASGRAAATCAYIKNLSTSATQLVCANSKLAPPQGMTIPRLELVGIVIASKLAKKLVTTLPVQIHRVVMWTDSSVALHWVLGQASATSDKGQFVRNRVKTIHSNLEAAPHEFRHISGTDNPADLPSRGCNFNDLKNMWPKWLTGPTWLPKPQEEWPQSLNSENLPAPAVDHLNFADSSHATTHPFTHDHIVLEHLVPSPLLTRFSKVTSTLHTLLLILQFLYQLRPTMQLFTTTLDSDFSQHIFNFTHVNRGLVSLAEHLLLRRAQVDHPPTARERCQYSIFEDLTSIHGPLLRCNPRTSTHLPESYNRRYPIFLCKTSPLVKLIILHFHQQERHAGTAHVITAIRQHFWIPKLRQLVKSTIRSDCYHCKRYVHKPYRLPAFAPLPMERLTRPSHPFESCGLDYAGPFGVKDDNNLCKVWICLFTCLATRAVHCELVRSLSSIDFIRALRRFASFFGFPSKIIMDNQTAFHLAAKILGHTTDETPQLPTGLTKYAQSHGTLFHFTTPHSPWEGGIYERMIGFFKQSLRHSFSRKALDLEEFRTVIPEVCAVLNRRPLVPVHSDDHDIDVLRPIDFLMPSSGRLELPDLDPSDEWTPQTTPQTQVENWLRKSQALLNKFWTEFSSNYITALQQRWQKNHAHQRGSNAQVPKIGDIVLIVDEARPRHDWPLGQITNLLRDNRVAEVRKFDGTVYSRPFCDLVPLETSSRPSVEPEKPAHKPNQQGHPMVTRSKVLTTAITCLVIASFLPVSHAAACNEQFDSLLYIPPCAARTIAIAQSKSTLCHLPINCPNGHTQELSKNSPKSYCGPYCACPQWSSGCVHLLPITIHPPDPATEARLATLRPPEICSFDANEDRCSRHSHTKTFAQVTLPSGSIHVVKHLQVSLVDFDKNGPVVCYASENHQLQVTSAAAIVPKSVTGTTRLCMFVQCASDARTFCFFPPTPALLQGSNFTVPISAWGSATYTYYPFLNLNVPANPQLHGTCRDNTMELTIKDPSTSNSQYSIDICYDNFCSSRSTTTQNVRIQLPNLPVNAELQLHLWKSGSITSTLNITCTSLCDATCTWCWSHIRHPQCLTTFEWIQIYLLLSLLAVIVHTLSHTLNLLAYSSKLFFFICKIFIICRIFRPIVKIVRPILRIFKQLLCLPFRPLQALHARFRRQPPAPTRRQWIPPSAVLTIIIFIILVPTSSHGCSTTTSFDSSTTTCTQHDNVLNCSTEGTTILNLRANKAESCMVIVNDKKEPLGTLALRVENLETVCNKDTLYYTRDHEIRVQSHHRCSHCGSCDDNDYCKRITADTIIPEFDGDARTAPGFTSCYSACGCVTCGCFFCSASCVFSRMYAMPTSSTIYEVFRCPSWDVRITLHVSLQYNNVDISHSFTVLPGEQYTLPNVPVSVTVLSSSLPPLPILGTDFISDGTRTAIVTANPPNHFTGGLVGQLQCSSRYRATEFKCKFRPQICSCSQASRSLLCACPSGNVHDTIETYLPTTYHNIEFLPDKNTILARIGLSQLQVQTTFAGLQLSVLRQDHRCDVTPLSLSGCLSCGEGAEFKYKCRSSQATTAIIQCGNSIGTIECGSTDEIFKTTLLLNSRTVAINCTTHCGRKSYFMLEGQLEEKAKKETELQMLKIEDVKHNEFTITEFIANLSHRFFSSIFNSPLVYILIVLIVIFILRKVEFSCLEKRKTH